MAVAAQQPAAVFVPQQPLAKLREENLSKIAELTANACAKLGTQWAVTHNNDILTSQVQSASLLQQPKDPQFQHNQRQFLEPIATQRTYIQRLISELQEHKPQIEGYLKKIKEAETILIQQDKKYEAIENKHKTSFEKFQPYILPLVGVITVAVISTFAAARLLDKKPAEVALTSASFISSKALELIKWSGGAIANRFGSNTPAATSVIQPVTQ